MFVSGFGGDQPATVRQHILLMCCAWRLTVRRSCGYMCGPLVDRIQVAKIRSEAWLCKMENVGCLVGLAQ